MKRWLCAGALALAVLFSGVASVAEAAVGDDPVEQEVGKGGKKGGKKKGGKKGKKGGKKGKKGGKPTASF